ncbi:MAG: isoprenyl transferase [Mangrovicoccus sp.]
MAAKDTSQASASHVAVIMDGNGRWAVRRGQPRLFGHKAGAKTVKSIVRACPDLGVRYLTLYAFSTENWKRSPEEISGLMALFRRFIRSEAEELIREGVRVRFIGDRAPLDAKLLHLMAGLEADTAHNETLNLNVAINYGSRDELTRAMSAMARDVANGRLCADNISSDLIGTYLDTHPMPDPDLVIRTSGEARVSNFLLWQCAYSEFAFTQTLWPDFNAEEFARLVLAFGTRERRFGAVVS